MEEVEAPRNAETGSNTKVKFITAAALGGLGLAAAYVESRGWVNGWPPPAHSLKHPWVGYYAAWAASKVRRRRVAATVAVATTANFAVESAQDFINSSNHYPFHWLELHQQGQANNLDNVADFAACMGGAVLSMVQDGIMYPSLKHRMSGIKRTLSDTEPQEPSFETVE